LQKVFGILSVTRAFSDLKPKGFQWRR
jgi:hypothetical protein